MKQLVGHGHPVTGKEWAGNATLVNQHYNGRYEGGHKGFHSIIGWKKWNLYKSRRK